MTALIVPFPAQRRVALIHAIVARALQISPDAGEKHIQHSVRVQADFMRRNGVAEAVIARETAVLDAAVRALLWNTVMAPRGAR